MDHIPPSTTLASGGRPHPSLGHGASRSLWLRSVGFLLVVLVSWLAWSVGGALTAGGTDSTATRLADWARFHGLGWAVGDTHSKASLSKADGRRAAAIPTVSPSQPGSSHPTRPMLLSYLAPPAPVPPQAQPAAPDEGLWQPLVSLHGQTVIRAAFLRPDAQFTNARVGVAWLNQKLAKMVLHPGYTAPGGSGWSQPSQVPSSQRDSLLATFNSGFLMPAAQGGYWQDGATAMPLRRGAASMVLYKDGHVDVVRWNAATPGPDVAAVRQNLTLLVENGSITADVDNASWGATLGGGTYVWRSAVGIRRDGALVFAVGPSMSARTLANIMHGAGAVRAMELDINPEWTNFITYTHPSQGAAVPHMLTRDEQPNPYRYLQPSSRDFVAVLAR